MSHLNVPGKIFESLLKNIQGKLLIEPEVVFVYVIK